MSRVTRRGPLPDLGAAALKGISVRPIHRRFASGDMISFASFPAPAHYDSYDSHSKVRREIDEDDDMDLDYDDDVTGGKLACPGETITSSHAFMRSVVLHHTLTSSRNEKCISGHGTYVDGDEVISSVAGTVERVNKLFSVRPARTRYGVILRTESLVLTKTQVQS